jgi:hypothetical protein
MIPSSNLGTFKLEDGPPEKANTRTNQHPCNGEHVPISATRALSPVRFCAFIGADVVNPPILIPFIGLCVDSSFESVTSAFIWWWCGLRDYRCSRLRCRTEKDRSRSCLRSPHRILYFNPLVMCPSIAGVYWCDSGTNFQQMSLPDSQLTGDEGPVSLCEAARTRHQLSIETLVVGPWGPHTVRTRSDLGSRHIVDVEINPRVYQPCTYSKGGRSRAKTVFMSDLIVVFEG